MMTIHVPRGALDLVEDVRRICVYSDDAGLPKTRLMSRLKGLIDLSSPVSSGQPDTRPWEAAYRTVDTSQSL
jgi:hypothetical protein